MIWRWLRATAWAPSTGSTGAVPKGRVSCPTPSPISLSQSAGAAATSCWCGTTSPPIASIPTQTPYSWATFSPVVIREIRSRTRSAGACAGSRQISVGPLLSVEPLLSIITWVRPSSRNGLTGRAPGHRVHGAFGPVGGESFTIGGPCPERVDAVVTRARRDMADLVAQAVDDRRSLRRRARGQAVLPGHDARGHREGSVGADGDVADRDTGAWFHQGEDSRIKRYRQRLTSPGRRAKLCGKPAGPAPGRVPLLIRPRSSGRSRPDIRAPR